jgi:hypothetical protein
MNYKIPLESILQIVCKKITPYKVYDTKSSDQWWNGHWVKKCMAINPNDTFVRNLKY